MNGTVHNPHFYEYMRANRGGVAPRNPGDIPCGGMPTLYEMRSMVFADEEQQQQTYHLHRMIRHVIDSFMTSIQARITARTEKTRRLGIDYLRKKMDREEWVHKLFLLQKRVESYERLYEMLETFTFNASEVFRQFCHGLVQHDDLIRSISTLMECYNGAIKELNHQFNKKHSYLSIDMAIHQIR